MRKRIPHRINDLGIEEKWCKDCESWVNINSFNIKSSSWDGLETSCMKCKRVKSAKFRLSNPEYDKNYQIKNKDKIKEYKKEYYRIKRD